MSGRVRKHGIERPTREDGVGTDSPLARNSGDPPILGLAPDRACLHPFYRAGGLLPRHFTSHPVFIHIYIVYI